MNNKLPEFSIIVNCLNGEQFLKRSLNSIFNQTYEDWEVIFFDNNSSDSSADIAKSYGSKIKYYKANETHSLGKARDVAVDLAKGKFIAYLDVDDLWQKNKLEIQRSLFNDSIAKNIAYGDDKIDMIKLKESALLAEVRSNYKSVHLRSQITIDENNLAVVKTKCFGAFQAVIMKKPVMIHNKDSKEAVAFKKLAKRIDGVDLSGEMLKLARKRRIYKSLTKSDIISHLNQVNRRYDLVTGADVFVYFGELNALLAGIEKTLKSGGFLVFSVETNKNSGFELTPSGRYAHGRSYVREVAKDAGLNECSVNREILRQEYGEPVFGDIWVFQAQGG